MLTRSSIIDHASTKIIHNYNASRAVQVSLEMNLLDNEAIVNLNFYFERFKISTVSLPYQQFP